MKRLLAVAGASEGLVVETISMTQEDGDTTVRGLLGEGVVDAKEWWRWRGARWNKRQTHKEQKGRNHFWIGRWRGKEGGNRGRRGGGGEKEGGGGRLASLKSPNPLTSVAGAKMEDHTAF